MILSDQNVLITGAAEGLGFSVAQAFSNQNSNLFLVDKNIEKLNSNNINNSYNLHCDLSNIEDVKKLIEILNKKKILIDTLIHNAAILYPKSFTETNQDYWDQVVNITLNSAFILSKYVWHEMKNKKNGVIIFVSSRAGVQGFKDESAYCAAKHGLEGLMKSLAIEGESYGIQVFTVTPGMYMKTAMSEKNYEDEYKKKWIDPINLTPAFLKLAQRDFKNLSGKHVNAWDLSNEKK